MGTRLANKVCVVTGAGSGIGQASARLFASEGGRVVVADIVLAAARETAEEIAKAGADAVAEQVDVTDETQTAGLAALVVDRFGRIDVLFNKAGIAGEDALEETTTYLIDRMTSVNGR